MNRLKLAVGIILVLLVGALAGSLATGMYQKQRMEKFAGGGPSPHLRKAFVNRLADKLDLTEKQRVEIEKIVKESQAKIFAIRRQYLPEIREINDQSFSLIKEKLNPEQQKKMEVLHEHLKTRHSKAFIQSIQIEESSKQILAKMKKRLNLTPDQEKKGLPIIEESIKKRRRIIRKYREKDRPDFFAVRQEMREIQASLENGLDQILTRQQMEEYLKIHEEFRPRMRPEKRRRKAGGPFM